jgi:hypothetical protein
MRHSQLMSPFALFSVLTLSLDMSKLLSVMATPDYRSIYEDLATQLCSLQEMRAELEAKLGDVSTEMERLEETMSHLAPLAGYLNDPDSIVGLGITEAVRTVLDRKIRMSAAEVKAKMEERGFDFSAYSAPDASIRTVLKRLVEAKKAGVEKEGWKTFYKYLPTDEEIPF